MEEKRSNGGSKGEKPMAELIKIQNEEKAPRVVCPRCKEEIYMDITQWQQDCTKIMQDKCPKCRGTIYAGVLILCNTELKNLLHCIRLCIEAMAGASKIIGGKRSG